MQVPIVENVLKLNDEVAAINREAISAAGVFCIDLIGAPGCGKTALLEATLKRLGERLKIGILVGDLTTARDAERMARFCDHVVQINTGKGCHLDANQVRQGLAQVDLPSLDLLVIENVGNLICPVGFDLGQDMKVGMFSLAEGDDKPAKHPYLVHEASLLVLNKIDLKPYVAFDLDRFYEDVRRLNPGVSVLEVSATAGAIDPWIGWLEERVAASQGKTDSV